MKLIIIGCLLSLAVELGTAQKHSAGVCINGANRRCCGQPGISEGDCRALDCCFEPSTPGVPKCFYKSEVVTDTCKSVPVEIREECGFVGITESECLTNKKCCYDTSVPDASVCFYRDSLLCHRCRDVPEDKREICGKPGLNEEQCLELNCCYNPLDPAPQLCFYPIAMGKLCRTVGLTERQKCGKPDVTEDECIAMDCCYDPTVPDIQCFVKPTLEQVHPLEADPAPPALAHFGHSRRGNRRHRARHARQN